jgi:hypothetical protein
MTRTTINYTIAALVSCSAILSGCSPLSLGGESPVDSRRVVVERQYPVNAEGSVNYVWEEPTREVVDVPPGVDAEGHYYRPGHQAVVETLPGRYKFYSD